MTAETDSAPPDHCRFSRSSKRRGAALVGALVVVAVISAMTSMLIVNAQQRSLRTRQYRWNVQADLAAASLASLANRPGQLDLPDGRTIHVRDDRVEITGRSDVVLAATSLPKQTPSAVQETVND